MEWTRSWQGSSGTSALQSGLRRLDSQASALCVVDGSPMPGNRDKRMRLFDVASDKLAPTSPGLMLTIARHGASRNTFHVDYPVAFCQC